MNGKDGGSTLVAERMPPNPALHPTGRPASLVSAGRPAGEHETLGRQSAGTQARSRHRRQRIEGPGNRAASEGDSFGVLPPGQAPTPIGDSAGPSPRATRRRRALRWATPEPPSVARQAEAIKLLLFRRLLVIDRSS
jgi:hypothetical protein